MRQEPAARDALGPIKFELPNGYGIGLHGTPSKRMFGQPALCVGAL